MPTEETLIRNTRSRDAFRFNQAGNFAKIIGMATVRFARMFSILFFLSAERLLRGTEGTPDIGRPSIAAREYTARRVEVNNTRA